MKGDAGVIRTLNEVLVGELTAINQYFLGAKLCKQQGYQRLHDRLRAESLEEMKHADMLIERILFLEGLPNVQKLEKVRVGETVPEQLKADLDLERKSVTRLNGAITRTRARGDAGSADLLETLLAAAEAHVEWLETQVDLLASLGKANYLAQQLGKDA